MWRRAAIASGAALLVGMVASPAFAEEVVDEAPPAEEVVEEAPPAEEVVEEAPPAEESTDQAADEEGVWSVVDENGVVTDAIICTERICGAGGEFDQMGGFPGGRLVFQQPGYAGFATDGYIDVEYNWETEHHEISEPLIVDEQVVGRQTTIVPKGQGERQDSPRVRSTDTLVPNYSLEGHSGELPLSVELDSASGFAEEPANYVELRIETTERSLLLSYLSPEAVVENLERDVGGEDTGSASETDVSRGQLEEAGDDEEQRSNPIVEFAGVVVGFVRSLFGI